MPRLSTPSLVGFSANVCGAGAPLTNLSPYGVTFAVCFRQVKFKSVAVLKARLDPLYIPQLQPRCMSLLPRISNSAPRLLASTQRATVISSHLFTPTGFSRTMASIPKTMKGVIIEKNGGPEVLQYKEDLPVPQPKDGQVLVKNDYIGINYIDT